MPATQSSVILPNCIAASVNLFLQMTMEVQLLMVTLLHSTEGRGGCGSVESNIYSTIQCTKKRKNRSWSLNRKTTSPPQAFSSWLGVNIEKSYCVVGIVRS